MQDIGENRSAEAELSLRKVRNACLDYIHEKDYLSKMAASIDARFLFGDLPIPQLVKSDSADICVQKTVKI